MKRNTREKTAAEKNPTGRSLKQNLAVATVAASLGVSLGVQVGEALAVDVRLDSPPSPVSRQDKDRMTSGQIKLSDQLKMSNQGKFSNQHKWEQPSSQVKGEGPSQQNMQPPLIRR